MRQPPGHQWSQAQPAVLQCQGSHRCAKSNHSLMDACSPKPGPQDSLRKPGAREATANDQAVQENGSQLPQNAKWAPLGPSKGRSPARPPRWAPVLSLSGSHRNPSEGLSPPAKYSSLPQGGALPLPDRHVVHRLGEGGISAAHGHSCGYKEQQPERHDHEALPGQEQGPTDPHPRQPQLPRTPAAARSSYPAPHAGGSRAAAQGGRQGLEPARSGEGGKEKRSPGSPESTDSSLDPASAFQPGTTRCPLLHPKKRFLDAPLGRREEAGKGEEGGRCGDEGHGCSFSASLRDATLTFSWARPAEVWHQKFITQRSQASVSDIKEMS